MSMMKFFRSMLTKTSDEIEVQAMPQLKVCKDDNKIQNFRTTEMLAIPEVTPANSNSNPSSSFDSDFNVTSEQWCRVTSELVDLNLETQSLKPSSTNFQFDPKLDELESDFNQLNDIKPKANHNAKSKANHSKTPNKNTNNGNKLSTSSFKTSTNIQIDEKICENHALLNNLFDIPTNILQLISPTDARNWKALPLKLEGSILTVLYSSTTVKPLLAQHFANKCPEYTVKFQETSWSTLQDFIEHHYSNVHAEIVEMEEQQRFEECRAYINQLDSEIELPSGIKFEHGKRIDETNVFLTIIIDAFCKAHSMRATDCDLHLDYESMPGGNVKTYLVIRIRVDRQMTTIVKEPMSPPTFVKLLTVLKSLANIDTSSYGNAITGTIRAELVYGAKLATIEMRCEITPTNQDRCAAVSIRFQYKSDFVPDFDNIGLLPDQKREMIKISRFSDGLIIFSGPINSGKQTTMHASLAYDHKTRGDKKIVSLEDPIEFRMKGIVQIAVEPGVVGSDGEEHGYVYFLKSILRANVDVLAIGETRDQETAQIVIDAADSGCKVCSTFHAANANKVVERLMDFVKQPARLADSLKAIINQKLIRRNCSHCEKVEDLDLPEIPRLNEYIEKTGYKGIPRFSRSTGKTADGNWCKKCHGTGLHGLVGVFEILLLSQRLRDLILQRVPSYKIRTEAIQRFGFKTLWINGLTRALMGDISLFELINQVGDPVPENEGLLDDFDQEESLNWIDYSQNNEDSLDRQV